MWTETAGARCGATPDGLAIWETVHAQALALGHGELVAPDEQRVAATDELLAAALPALVRVGALVAVGGVMTDGADREIAAVLHLIDAALVAHGRDHGYGIDAWRSRAVTSAWVTGDDVLDGDATLPDVSDEAVRRIALVFMALSRDRLGVAEQLAEAIGQLLVLYARSSGALQEWPA